MKKLVFLLVFIPLSVSVFAQGTPPVKPNQVGTGSTSDANKPFLMDANGRGILGDANLYWKVGGNTLTGDGIFGTTSNHSLIFKTNNLERLRILSNGNIGIGTNIPSSTFHVTGNTLLNGELNIRSNAAFGGWNLLQTSGGNFDISYAGFAQNVVHLNYTNGNVGFGTTSPSTKIDVNGTAKMTGLQLTTGASNNYILKSDATGVASWAALIETDPKLGSLTNNYVPKWSGSTLVNTQIYDNSTGVGIGTTSPATRLDVNGGGWSSVGGQIRVYSNDDIGSALTLNNYSSGGRQWSFLSTGPAALGGAGLFSVYDNTTGGTSGYRMVINSTGNLGIGTTSPTQKLHVVGKARIETLDGGSNSDSLVTADATGLLKRMKIADIFNPKTQQYTEMSTSAPQFGQLSNKTNELSNILWKSDKRFSIGGKSSNALFDGDFSTNVSIINGDSVTITFPSAITYIAGNVYSNYYYTAYPQTAPILVITLNNGDRYSYSASDVSYDATYKIHKYTLLNNINYMTKITLLFSSACNLAELTYIPLSTNSIGPQEPPFFNKFLTNNNYHGIFNFLNTTNTVHQIYGGGNAYFANQNSSFAMFGTSTAESYTKVTVRGETTGSYNNGLVVHNSAGNNFGLLVRDDGFIGLSNNSPQYKLDISSGSVNLSNSQSYRIKNSSGSSLSALTLDGSNTFALANNSIYANSSGNIGIGVSSPIYKLDIANQMRIGAQGGSDFTLIEGGTGYGSQIKQYSASGIIQNWLSANGNSYILNNLGIGTSSPSVKLHVVGAARIETLPSGTNTDSTVTVDQNGNLRMRKTADLITKTPNLSAVVAADKSTGDNLNFPYGFGIGAGIATETYNRWGQTRLRFGLNLGGGADQYSGGNAVTTLSGYGAVNFATSDSTRLRVGPNGYIGVNTLNPTDFLHVFGGAARVQQTNANAPVLKLSNTGINSTNQSNIYVTNSINTSINAVNNGDILIDPAGTVSMQVNYGRKDLAFGTNWQQSHNCSFTDGNDTSTVTVTDTTRTLRIYKSSAVTTSKVKVVMPAYPQDQHRFTVLIGTDPTSITFYQNTTTAQPILSAANFTTIGSGDVIECWFIYHSPTGNAGTWFIKKL